MKNHAFATANKYDDDYEKHIHHYSLLLISIAIHFMCDDILLFSFNFTIIHVPLPPCTTRTSPLHPVLLSLSVYSLIFFVVFWHIELVRV